MKIYLVGGAVRDKLLGYPVKERDYVVVGATVADMLALGYQQVGKEFPVFLHPRTNEEYALARTERKTKPGYTGFSFNASSDVTLSDDLMRRDLTINAIAESEEGDIVDPYHGQKDLKDKILRHVSFAFTEDPVRILRVGRFLARYAHLGFTVADETLQLMRNMVATGEVDALVAERVWKELERALGEKNPEKFFEVLLQANAANKLFPQLKIDGKGLEALKTACGFSDSPLIRWAALLYQMPEEAIKELCRRYRVPNAYRELALLTRKYAEQLLAIKNSDASSLLNLFYQLDVFRRMARFENILTACKAIALTQQCDLPVEKILASANHIKEVDVKVLMAEGYEGQALANQLRIKRLEQLNAWLMKNKF